VSDLRRRLERLRQARGPNRGEARARSALPEGASADKEDLISILRERIARLDVPRRPRRRAAPREVPDEPLRREEVGELCDTPYGPCVLRRQCFPLGHYHGGTRLSSLLELSTARLGSLVGEEALGALNLREAAFLDAETTGLAMGTGTYAFLVGVGYFARDEFIVDQFFMRDYSEELALLHLLGARLADARALVTFNGKNYDIPLLQTRFTMARMAVSLDDFPHLDLLYPARRLWRERLESCRLSYLEQMVLMVEREDDVPGELVPRIYFDYVRGVDDRLIERVFTHNLTDVLSLVTLAARVLGVLHDPYAAGTIAGSDFYSLGRIHEDLGSTQQSQTYYHEALQLDAPMHVRKKALTRLSMLYKRQRRYDEAMRSWEMLMSDLADFDLLPYEELAKYYEHRERNWDRALEIVEEALMALGERSGLAGPGQRWAAALIHRRDRLLRKRASREARKPQQKSGEEREKCD